MRRWNGWGDTTIDYPTPARATEFLEQWVKPARQIMKDVLY
jgi:hypothetical protein